MPELIERVTDARQALSGYPSLVRVVWAEAEHSDELFPLRINEVKVNGVTCVFFMPDEESGAISLNRAMERELVHG